MHRDPGFAYSEQTRNGVRSFCAHGRVRDRAFSSNEHGASGVVIFLFIYLYMHIYDIFEVNIESSLPEGDTFAGELDHQPRPVL